MLKWERHPYLNHPAFQACLILIAYEVRILQILRYIDKS
ncbi:hypothetical protein C1A50_3866 [Paenibacillus polymyxa]|nr:hypothetical protein C1A50_3866 [Paenibacillus polymyxa]